MESYTVQGAFLAILESQGLLTFLRIRPKHFKMSSAVKGHMGLSRSQEGARGEANEGGQGRSQEGAARKKAWNEPEGWPRSQRGG